MKRILDIAVAATLLILASIPILVLMIFVRVMIGRPIFFRQIRPGLNGKPFLMTKFRTMSDRKDNHGLCLSDADRLTSFGRFLRSTSLDELPELLNVLKGDMSLVGPRPLLMSYLPLYSAEQARRHEVRPGITGWAQINGRNAISWNEKFKFDIWYVDNYSVWLDLKIMLLTTKRVISREGVSAPDEATMSPFKGNQ